MHEIQFRLGSAPDQARPQTTLGELLAS